MLLVEERVDTLESVLKDFIAHTDRLESQMDRLEEDTREFKREMREFKDEMREFKDEMSEFKDEMSEFKDEMSEFKDEMSNFRRESNKQWGALANKMGTIDEDLIAPATRPFLSKYFDCNPIDRSIRLLRRIGNEEFEVDVLVVCSDKVFMIEVRSTPRTEYVKEIQEKAIKFKKFYPEYNDKELIPVYGSIIFPENVIKYATKKGLYLMAYREWDYVDIINFDEINKKTNDYGQNESKI
jgi:hypothetical protein